MKRPTDRQLIYLYRLIEGQEKKGTLAALLPEVAPEFSGPSEDFKAWAANRDKVRVSDLITGLERHLGRGKNLRPEEATGGLEKALSGLVSSYKRKKGRGYYRRD
jgi:hypothetical protein